jgi:heme-degrading monooxygenase HmoA
MLAARTSTLTGATRLDDGIKAFEREIVPKLRSMPGFAGATLHVDRAAKKMVATTYWESEAALEASEKSAGDLRQAAAKASGATAPPKVERFECPVVSEIRVGARA